MSFETATATDHFDLLDRIKTFCESTITPVGERWTVERYIGAQAYLASSFLGGYEPFLAFNGDASEEWRTAEGQVTPSDLGCDFVVPVDVRRVVMRAPNSTLGGGTPDMAPATWDLQWSNTGSVWNTLQSFASTFSNGEELTFNVTAASPGAQRYWRVLVATNNGNAQHTALARLGLESEEGAALYLDHTQEAQLIMRGPGLAGSDAVYVGLQIYSRPTLDIYNFRLAAFTGYVASNSFATQPGNFGTPIGFPLWNQPIEYWLAANGRRLALVAKVETTYQTGYLGFTLPYATPGQWPYPIAALGMLPGDTLTRYSDPSVIGPWSAVSARLRIRDAAGGWLFPALWPWLNTDITLRDVPGGFGVVPAVLSDAGNVYGELDGVGQVTGFAQAVENTITINAVQHLAVQDVYRTDLRDYHTLRLD